MTQTVLLITELVILNLQMCTPDCGHIEMMHFTIFASQDWPLYLSRWLEMAAKLRAKIELRFTG